MGYKISGPGTSRQWTVWLVAIAMPPWGSSATADQWGAGQHQLPRVARRA
jgi:hypothetical protein